MYHILFIHSSPDGHGLSFLFEITDATAMNSVRVSEWTHGLDGLRGAWFSDTLANTVCMHFPGMKGQSIHQAY
jgi:hypothetical protein